MNKQLQSSTRWKPFRRSFGSSVRSGDTEEICTEKIWIIFIWTEGATKQKRHLRPWISDFLNTCAGEEIRLGSTTAGSSCREPILHQQLSHISNPEQKQSQSVISHIGKKRITVSLHKFRFTFWDFVSLWLKKNPPPPTDSTWLSEHPQTVTSSCD